MNFFMTEPPVNEVDRLIAALCAQVQIPTPRFHLIKGIGWDYVRWLPFEAAVVGVAEAKRAQPFATAIRVIRWGEAMP
jgi:hypothetical protein